MRIPSRDTLLRMAVVLALVFLAYQNHFHNGFHFDDFHTTTTNPWIRDLRNIPEFFKNADTFSTLPANRGWRPLVTTSLAIDYAIAGGLRPGIFEVSTFFWFVVQLCLMYVLFRHLLDRVQAGAYNREIALFAVAVYGVHPAIAETVNYIIQRGDVYSTLAVIASLVLYIGRPNWRRYGVYLAPLILGLLSKPPALIFPAILFVYLMLFEDLKPAAAALRSAPSLVVCAIFGVLSNKMTPKSYDPGAWPALDYRITQPLVALRYFRSFFLPLYLSADTDHVAESNIFYGYAWAGVLFVLLMIGAAVYCGRKNVLKPIAFGFWWFLLTLVPTSVFPLGEVENDHRMFFPFVGLVLAIVWAAALLVKPFASERRLQAAMIACAVILGAGIYGTRQRNLVWRNEETLWYDVTLKSPMNGRGLMNYGLTQMEKGDYRRALDYFNRAVIFNPDYYVLEINLGIANGALGNDRLAEQHFARSRELAPEDAQVLYFYAVYLRGRNRFPEAIDSLKQDIQFNPDYLDARYLLMQIYYQLGNQGALMKTAQELLAQFPTDSVAQDWINGKVPAE